MFRIGQKVVCINDRNLWRNSWGGQEEGPRFNDIVTIRGFDGCPSVSADRQGLLFVEYQRGHIKYANGNEAGFDQRLFRPLTDISMFQKFTKVRELEDV